MYKIKQLLGAKIKALRNKRGLTQEYFAEKIGLSPRSVSFIENGKHTLLQKLWQQFAMFSKSNLTSYFSFIKKKIYLK